MKKPNTKVDFEAIAAHMISQEIAMACLLEALAKQQPSLARSVAASMKESILKMPLDKVPGLELKIETYLSLINTQLSKNPQ